MDIQQSPINYFITLSFSLSYNQFIQRRNRSCLKQLTKYTRVHIKIIFDTNLQNCKSEWPLICAHIMEKNIAGPTRGPPSRAILTVQFFSWGTKLKRDWERGLGSSSMELGTRSHSHLTTVRNLTQRWATDVLQYALLCGVHHFHTILYKEVRSVCSLTQCAACCASEWEVSRAEWSSSSWPLAVLARAALGGD